jgi:hypothetical protein
MTPHAAAQMIRSAAVPNVGEHIRIAADRENRWTAQAQKHGFLALPLS